MLGFYNYTVILTYLSLASSIFGIYAAMEGNVFVAIVALLVSGFCDMFDGKVARTRKRTKAEQRFGIQIDSLCDLICFGILPTTIGYSVGLNTLYYLPILIMFPLSALIRLAYFNVLEEERQDQTDEKRKSYLGLPVTSVALIIPLVYSLRKFMGCNFTIVYAATLVVVALLFLIKFKIKKAGNKGMCLMGIAGLLELILLIKWK